MATIEEALPYWRHQQVIGLNLVFIYIFKVVEVCEDAEIKTNQPILFLVIRAFPGFLVVNGDRLKFKTKSVVCLFHTCLQNTSFIDLE